MGAFVIAPLYLQNLGYTATLIAFMILMRTGALTLASPIGGRIGEIWGERKASIIGCAIMTIGLAITVFAAANEYLAPFLLGLVLQGVGHGLSQPSITAAIARSVDESDLGVAAASNRLMGQGGAAFGITLLMLAYGGDKSPEAFALAFAVGTGLSVVSVGAAMFMGAPKVRLAMPTQS